MGNTKKFYNNKHNIKSYSSKFKDYDINKIKDELQIGEIPTEDIITEMKADAELLYKSKNLVDMLKCCNLFLALSVISKLKYYDL